MGVYYVTHPNIGISAKVEAPATEKARTTLLDYLERTGHVSRADRQKWRRNMVAEKMESPEDVFADIDLTYGYAESGAAMPAYGGAEPRNGALTGTESNAVEGQEWGTDEYADALEEPMPAVVVEEEERAQSTSSSIAIQALAKRTAGKMMPIQRRSLKGYVE